MGKLLTLPGTGPASLLAGTLAPSLATSIGTAGGESYNATLLERTSYGDTNGLIYRLGATPPGGVQSFYNPYVGGMLARVQGSTSGWAKVFNRANGGSNASESGRSGYIALPSWVTIDPAEVAFRTGPYGDRQPTALVLYGTPVDSTTEVEIARRTGGTSTGGWYSITNASPGTQYHTLRLYCDNNSWLHLTDVEVYGTLREYPVPDAGDGVRSALPTCTNSVDEDLFYDMAAQANGGTWGHPFSVGVATEAGVSQTDYLLNRSTSAHVEQNGIAQIDLVDREIQVYGFKVWGGIYGDRDPESWDLQGSEDGVAWTTLCESGAVDLDAWSGFGSSDRQTWYRHLRLRVLNSSYHWISFAELLVYGNWRSTA